MSTKRLSDAEYLEIAANHPAWLHTKFSFALEGIILDESSQIDAGRQIAGHVTAEQLYLEICNELGLKYDPSNAELLRRQVAAANGTLKVEG